ncbi:Peptide transporter family 1 (Oligopeptide transporter 1) (Protein YIN), partial [Durusdinium trenchii]
MLSIPTFPGHDHGIGLRHLIAVGGLLLVSLVAIPSDAAEWPRFRGENGRARAEAAAPISWSADEGIVWRREMPGYGASSPIVVGPHVFLTYYANYGQGEGEAGDRGTLACHTLCCDRSTGEILWDSSIPAAEVERKYEGFIRQHGYSSATPCCDGERVYSFFGTSGVVAYDLTGQQLWHVEVGTKTHGFGTGASPVVHNELLLVNASIESERLIALNKQTGALVWEAANVRRCWGPPAVVTLANGSQEIILNIHSQMNAFSPEDGSLLWWCEAVPDYVCPSVVIDGEMIYGIGGRKSKCVAIRAGGRGDVTETHRVWSLDVGANVPSPVLVDGHLYWLSNNGQIFCVDTARGEMITRERTRAGRVYASVVAAGPYIYGVSRENGTFVFEATPEMPQVAHNVIEDDPSIFNGSLMSKSRYLTTPPETDRMPPGIPYIVGNEAAERFSFYGMKAILTVFMTSYLVNRQGELAPLSDEDAKFWVHTFVVGAYFFPLFGALISDWLWGKYTTILWLSIVYCLGHLALALDSTW